MSETDSAVLVLAGTEAAVYAYGLVAARLPAGAERSRALTAMAWHRAQRDSLRARITALGGTPPAAAAAYTPPVPVGDAASARRLAALVEDRLAGQWAGLAAATPATTRTQDARTAQVCAVRCVAWSGEAPIWNGAV
jgi:hypothetical protein